jgi:hypothetical protein
MLDLMNRKHRETICKFIASNGQRLKYNAAMFQIMEGNMAGLIDEKMMEDLGPESMKAAATRKAPINVFRKIVEKLTRIYSETVVRSVVGGTDKDINILRWYEQNLNINRKLGVNNQFYNAFQYSLLWMTIANRNEFGMGKPFIRTVPNHEFLVMNDNDIDPTSSDIVITLMPATVDAKGERRECYWVFSKSQFVIMDQHAELYADQMIAMGQDGSNPYGETPFVYTNASENLVMPAVQTDNLDMSLLIPLLLTDLNYAVKFQAFSLFYGIDIDDEQIKISPNSIMSFRSKPNADGESRPEFNVIKPTVDIASTLSLASSQMSLWLTTKGIRPGAIGQIGADQFASGVSKMIDESDTYESVKKQISMYEQTEALFWEKLLKVLHPFWVSTRSIELTETFSPSATVKTEFTKPEPMRTRRDLIDELDAEINAGFTTMKLAIKKLFPTMDDKAIDQHILDAREDMTGRNAVRAPKPQLQIVPDQDGAA